MWLLHVREYSKDGLDDGAQHSRATEELWVAEEQNQEIAVEGEGAYP